MPGIGEWSEDDANTQEADGIEVSEKTGEGSLDKLQGIAASIINKIKSPEGGGVEAAGVFELMKGLLSNRVTKLIAAIPLLLASGAGAVEASLTLTGLNGAALEVLNATAQAMNVTGPFYQNLTTFVAVNTPNAITITGDLAGNLSSIASSLSATI